MKEQQIARVREFNRFYTNIIGLLNQTLHNSDFSLPEARILYELGKRGRCTASDLMTELNIDRGYLSRIVSVFEKKEILTRKKSSSDGRSYFLTLSPDGKKKFKNIDRHSHDQIEAMLSVLSQQERKRLLQHMKGIQELIQRTT